MLKKQKLKEEKSHRRRRCNIPLRPGCHSVHHTQKKNRKSLKDDSLVTHTICIYND